jgi:hypothetical protein
MLQRAVASPEAARCLKDWPKTGRDTALGCVSRHPDTRCLPAETKSTPETIGCHNDACTWDLVCCASPCAHLTAICSHTVLPFLPLWRQAARASRRYMHHAPAGPHASPDYGRMVPCKMGANSKTAAHSLKLLPHKREPTLRLLVTHSRNRTCHNKTRTEPAAPGTSKPMIKPARTSTNKHSSYTGTRSTTASSQR